MEDGVRGRRENLSSKFFPSFPITKSTFIGNSAFLLTNLSFFMLYHIDKKGCIIYICLEKCFLA